MTFKTACVLWLGLISPAWGHEFWIEPFVYQVGPNQDINANLLVGENFVGPDYIFIPKGYETAKFVSPAGAVDIEFTGQEDPSLTFQTTEQGLHAIVLISNSNSAKHEDFAAFSAFAETVGRSAEVASSQADGPVNEAYFRYAKALVAVGDGAGTDRAYGAVYEWVAIDNPYDQSAKDLKFRLLFNGNPAANEPVQVVSRPDGAKGAGELIHVQTDADGLFLLPESIEGEIMLNSVKLLPAQSEDLDWISYWASLTFSR